VVDVQKYGDRIVHYLAQSVDPGVDLVVGEIDWQRRQNLMRHHTGTHVLIGSARRVLGEHVWQAGAQKEVESSRLDITHYQQITPKEREKIERLANQTILRDLPVRVNWMAREKAEAKYGYRLYQGGRFRAQRYVSSELSDGTRKLVEEHTSREQANSASSGSKR